MSNAAHFVCFSISWLTMTRFIQWQNIHNPYPTATIMGMRISQNSLNGAEKLAKTSHNTDGGAPSYSTIIDPSLRKKNIQTLATTATIIAATHFDIDFLLGNVSICIPSWCLRKVTLL